jgi:hypothetical protein
VLDPQLDVNVLIGLSKRTPEFVTCAHARSSAGRTYNEATADEFLASGNVAELQDLEQTFAITRILDVSLTEIDATAQLLERAFHADPWGHIIHSRRARGSNGFYQKRRTRYGGFTVFQEGQRPWSANGVYRLGFGNRQGISIRSKTRGVLKP